MESTFDRCPSMVSHPVQKVDSLEQILAETGMDGVPDHLCETFIEDVITHGFIQYVRVLRSWQYANRQRLACQQSVAASRMVHHD